MTAVSTVVASVVVSALVLGCDSGSAARSGVVVRDSAGASIVEYATAAPDTVHAGAALLTIGREGEPAYEFFRVLGVQVLSDGRIVVADGSQEIRYYSADGQHLQSLGGRGEGPGEFQFLNDLQRLDGDTIVANDARNRRATFFSPVPAFVETLAHVDELEENRPDDMGVCMFPRYVGLVAPRARVTMGWACAREEGREGVRPYRAEFRIWSPDDDEPLTLGPFTVGAAYERPDRELRRRFAFLRLAERSVVEVASGAIYVTSPDRYAVTVVLSDGSVRMVIRDRTPRRAVDQDLRASALAARSERTRDLPLPDSLPAFDGAVIGAGQIWLRHFPLPADSAKHWSVYAEDGLTRTVVGFPYDFDLMAVRAGRAYGTATDDLDIQRIQVFDVANVR